MAVSLTVSNIVAEASGRILVQFSDGVNLEFASLALLQESAASLDAKALCRRLALAYWYAKGMPPAAQVIGKSVVIDFAAGTVSIA